MEVEQDSLHIHTIMTNAIKSRVPTHPFDTPWKIIPLRPLPGCDARASLDSQQVSFRAAPPSTRCMARPAAHVDMCVFMCACLCDIYI